MTRPLRLPPVILAALLLLPLAALSPAARAQDEVPTALLHETQSWTLEWTDPPGNPFDVVATATFTHVPSGAVDRTELFWIGDGRYAFRFTPTLTGRWRFETESDAAPLDGFGGRLEVLPSDLPGALTTVGDRFARTADGELTGALHHTYHAFTGSDLADYVGDEAAVRRRVDATLDAIEAQGFEGLFLTLFHSVFERGAISYADHDRTDPDLAAFDALDLLLEGAHARGMTVHLWMWGDQRRRQTPRGLPGGAGGEVDRRLQRYIAARLGPLPGWTMAYGFDLEEWADPDVVRDWAAFLEARMQLPHPLTAREKSPNGGFDLGADKLDVFSVDDRPHTAPERSCYDFAVDRFEEQDGLEPTIPVLFERRFTHNRDDFWSAERTRRCLWQLTLAGGAASVWGEPFYEADPYPDPAPFRAFHDFWNGRFRLDFERAPQAAERSWALATPDRSTVVVYREDAAEVPLELGAMPAAAAAFAVDTVTGERVELGVLEPGSLVWSAPRRSDWAVAVGTE